MLGTLVVTLVAALVAIPVGVGGGIYLSEYSMGGWFARFVRFGNFPPTPAQVGFRLSVK